MSSWNNIESITGGVSDIASGIGEQADYTLGSVKFFIKAGSIVAANTDPESDVLLNYVTPSMETDQATNTLVLGTAARQKLLYRSNLKGSDYDATEDIKLFMGGSLAMCPVNSLATGEFPINAAIPFSILAIGLATAIKIAGGIEAGFKKNSSGGWSFFIQSTGPHLVDAAIRLRGPGGTGARMNIKFDNPSSGNVDVPPGVNVDPVIESLDIQLTLKDGSVRSFLDAIGNDPDDVGP